MKTLTPVLSIVCLMTVGAIAGAHHLKPNEDSMDHIEAYVGDADMVDPLEVVADRLERGERLEPGVNVIANAVSSSEVDYARWRWQQLKDLGSRAFVPSPDPTPGTGGRVVTAQSAKRAPLRHAGVPTTGGRNYRTARRYATDSMSMFERSKFRRKGGAYGNRTTNVARGRVYTSLREGRLDKADAIERYKYASKSRKAYDRLNRARARTIGR